MGYWLCPVLELKIITIRQIHFEQYIFEFGFDFSFTC